MTMANAVAAMPGRASAVGSCRGATTMKPLNQWEGERLRRRLWLIEFIGKLR